jgi:hypothetical protein
VIASEVQTRLQDLLAYPREGLDVELKGWLDLSVEEARANLAQAILALANHGGGYIVIGFAEKQGNWIPAKPRPKALNDFSQDSINGIVQRYGDPSFHCELHLVAHPTNGASFPIVVVPGVTEFRFVPSEMAPIVPMFAKTPTTLGVPARKVNLPSPARNGMISFGGVSEHPKRIFWIVSARFSQALAPPLAHPPRKKKRQESSLSGFRNREPDGNHWSRRSSQARSHPDIQRAYGLWLTRSLPTSRSRNFMTS